MAGTTYPLDRAFVQQQLGMQNLCRNSLDAVSDRDFVLDYLHAANLCMMHLSRLCEELIIFSTTEFGFITMDDGFATGSSMMPQKKNPDVAELIRGKTGRVYGNYVALLTVMKALPLAYDKDMQEDKEGFFDARDTLLKCLSLITPLLTTTTYNLQTLRAKALDGFTNATDLADYLVGKGVPFRDAHSVSGQLVAYCLGKQCALNDVPLTEMQKFSPAIQADVYDALSLDTCVNQRKVLGGPAPDNVRREAVLGWERLKELR